MNAATRIPVVLEFDSDDLPPGQETGNSPEEYTYDPLPDSHCFRVLELLPGDRDSRLECQLSIERLGDQDLPPYRTVSYTWTESKYDNLVIAGKKVTEFPGPREKYLIQHPVWINDRRLLISTNLRDALRTFRHWSQPLRLWVDAICIYPDRHRTKCCRNLRFEPLFCEGVGFAHLACRIGKFTLRVFIIEIYQYIAFYLYLTIC
jgi:hypothetical protein